MMDYEKLGVFYLGKAYNLKGHQRLEEPVLYDSKDLLTHAVIIGMTGSGKTGLGIGLLEEALIDNIPVIAIDPKGDLANLLLGFPQLRGEDFLPWVQPDEAMRQGLSVEQFAAQTADAWRKGLASWGQDPERIDRLQAAADFRVYTPGSNAGLPVNVLRSLSPPPPSIRDDTDLFREHIQATATALLTLMGIDADPLASREHILMTTILEQTWRAGDGLDLAGLIRMIQTPPAARIGVLDVESFYPAKERFQLALRLNNLLAAPGFDAWLTGEPLDIGRMLHTPQGKPRALIFSISHLPDSERMFFTALLLNAIVGWVRTQPGTASLRAVLYMDEIFGYFPPVRNPPSKAPLLTLLKQARAHGLGVVLSTQNPIDLDYKGLGNTGTWFIGRLQTENDKQRVMAGLEGAAVGVGFDRRQLDGLLSGLGKRVFLLHNVHDKAPMVFETRWVLSFLSGPMTRDQIKRLASRGDEPQPAKSAETQFATAAQRLSEAPVLPPDVATHYLPASGVGQGLTYMPAVGGWVEVLYRHQRLGIDAQQTFAMAAPLEDGPVPVDWDQALNVGLSAALLESAPLAQAAFGGLPAIAGRSGVFQKWQKDFVRWVRQNRPLKLYTAKTFKLTSSVGESEGAFRSRLTQAVHEARDQAVERLRRKYADKFDVLQRRQMRTEQALAREQEQAKAKKTESVISFGTAILGALLGRKVTSAGSVSRMGTAMKSAGRLRKEKMDVVRAQETLEAVTQSMAELESRLQQDIDKLDDQFDPAEVPLEEIRINARSVDLGLVLFGLIWLPYRQTADGRLTPDWS